MGIQGYTRVYKGIHGYTWVYMEKKDILRTICVVLHKVLTLTSVFYASALLLIMNFVITLQSSCGSTRR